MSMSVNVNQSLRQHMIDHVVGVIESTSAIQTPFPHMQINGFFPSDVYAQLLENLPNPAAYEPFAYENQKEDGESNRRRFRLVSECLDALPDSSRKFLYTVRSVLGSVALKEAVYNKLSYGLSLRYSCKPEAIKNLEGYALPELYHETQGYKIKPHPDTRKKVVTMQIALPEDESGKDMGTEFYRRSFSPASWLREPKGFDIVKTMPFVPNVAYAFVVLNTTRLKSWHGRCTLDAQCGVRNSLLNIWYEKAEGSNTELVEENRQLRRAA